MFNNADDAYLAVVREVLATGTRKENRTSVDTLSTFDLSYKIDLAGGFPLLTTKEINWKNIVVEMLWFLSGQTHIGVLKKHGCRFWDSWADKETGEVPSAYGAMWRKFPVHGELMQDDGPDTRAVFEEFNDQLAWVVGTLKRDPMSRRMVVSAWAPGNAQTSKLPPCHCQFIVNVQNTLNPLVVQLREAMTKYPSVFSAKWSTREHRIEAFLRAHVLAETTESRERVGQAIDSIDSGSSLPTEQHLCLHLTQRSCDMALGVPYNIASYALLMHLLSRFSGIPVGIFGHSLVDAHIYTAKPDGSMAEYDHVPGLKEQLQREPRQSPRLQIDPSITSLDDVPRLLELSTEELMSCFRLEGYEPWPAINFKVAV